MKHAVKGTFITFEGTEGVGKSTVIRTVSDHLKTLGFEVVLTREPGGSPMAESIRTLVLAKEMNPWTETFLYEASRVEHVHTVILPALKRGAVVLCDRFTDSTLAYQAEARGLDWKAIEGLNKLATLGLKPKLTVWLDLDPAVGLSRAKDPNRFELAGVKFQALVRKGYLKVSKRDPKRMKRVNVTDRTPEQVAASVIALVTKVLPKSKAAQK